MTIQLSAAGIESLLTQMARVGEQGSQIATYAERWVCQTEGFEASPICVLRPLSAAMHEIRAAFDDVAREFLDHWTRVEDEVRRVTAELVAQDVEVGRRFGALNGEVAR